MKYSVEGVWHSLSYLFTCCNAQLTKLSEYNRKCLNVESDCNHVSNKPGIHFGHAKNDIRVWNEKLSSFQDFRACNEELIMICDGMHINAASLL
jgi:hypothetical protein